MIVPALIYLALNAGGPAAAGWGVPMATDTAFALGLLAMLGRRVPLPLTVFVAALAIADDVGAILELALFYTSDISFLSVGVAAVFFGLALLFRRVRIYRPLPYALVGVALWLAVLSSGVHTTTAGVLLALAIPTRPPPRTPALLSQSIAAFSNLHAPVDGQRAATAYQQTVGVLETVLERLLSPAQRLERNLRPWSSYLILPLFALANAGIPLAGEPTHLLQPLSLGVIAGLVLGKPLGITLGAWLAVRLRLAELPGEFSWRQLIGGGVLCGIGFTMSIFIATAAFSDPAQLTLAKTSAMAASVLSGTIGWLVLRNARSPSEQRTPAESTADTSAEAAEQ
jgi:NhaA family Na+:H+ antiporter